MVGDVLGQVRNFPLKATFPVGLQRKFLFMKQFFLLSLALPVVLCISSCTWNNVSTEDGFKTYFDSAQVDGSFCLYDNGHNDFKIYDKDQYLKQISPVNTFDIVTSMIGLETGKVVDQKMIIHWDGVVRKPEWDKDLTMEAAFKTNATPYFQELARRLGKDTLKIFLDTLAYGNKNIQGAVDSFWLNDSLQVSPDETLGLVKKLYFKQLPFQKHTQELMTEIMSMESNSSYNLSYKTGNGFNKSGLPLGWVVGWIEENRHPYFFVLTVQGRAKDQDVAQTSLQLLKKLLQSQGFLQGKK